MYVSSKMAGKPTYENKDTTEEALEDNEFIVKESKFSSLRETFAEIEEDLQTFPWLDVRPIKDIFVDLEINVTISGHTDRRKLAHGDILRPITKTEQRPRTVLVQGGSGFGKTTLLKRIKRDWITESSKDLERYSLVILCNLTHVPKETSLEEELSNILCSLHKKPKDSLDELVNSFSASLLLLLDGFDEVSEERHNEVARIVKGNTFFNQSSIVVTAKVEHKKGFFELFDRHVQITGWNESSKDNVVHRLIGDSEENAKQFKFFLDDPNTPAVFWTSPLLLQVLCYLYMERGLQVNKFIKVVDVIIEFVKLLIQKHLSELSSSLLDKMEEKTEQILLEVGMFFLTSLEKNTTIYTEEELQVNFGQSWSIIRSCSIFQSIQNSKFQYHNRLLADALAVKCANSELRVGAVSKAKQVIQNVLGEPGSVQIFIVNYSGGKSFLVFRGNIDVLFYCIENKTEFTEGTFEIQEDFTTLVDNSKQSFQSQPGTEDLSVLWTNKEGIYASGIGFVALLIDSVISKIVNLSDDFNHLKKRTSSTQMCLHRELKVQETAMVNFEYGQSGFETNIGEETFRTCDDLAKTLFYPSAQEELEICEFNSGEPVHFLLNVRILQDFVTVSNRCRYQISEI